MHHTGPIAGVAAHDAWVAYDNRLILWDRHSREAIARTNHDHLVNACDFSQDGQWLVSASSDYSARVWSLPDLRLHAVLDGHEDDVDMACFSPDSARIATCALDRIVRVFDKNGQCHHAMGGHTGNVLSLAWIDNVRFVTTSVDGTLREWNAETGAALRIIPLGMRCDCIVVTAGGTLYSGDDAGRIAVITEGQEPAFVTAHAAGVKKLVLSRDGRALVSLGYDRAIIAWDIAESGQPVERGRSVLPPPIWARAAAICPDGRVAVGTFGGTYALFYPDTGAWELQGVTAGLAINAVTESAGALWTIGDNGELRRDGALAGGPGTLCNFLVDTGARLITGGHLGELYDAVSGQILYRHKSPINCAVSFSRNGHTHLAVGTYTGEILVFAINGNLMQLIKTLHPFANAVKGIACNSDSLFAVCANTNIAWLSLHDWREIRRVDKAHARIANACCMLADDGFASVGRDRMLRLWLYDADIALQTPHPNSVKCVAASPCGRWIASGSYGGTVVLFDRVVNAFLPMRRISKAGISTICWSATSRGFVAASYDGVLHVCAIPQTETQRIAA
jgi:toxoflavin biosynthesis protein ToxC